MKKSSSLRKFWFNFRYVWGESIYSTNASKVRKTTRLCVKRVKRLRTPSARRENRARRARALRAIVAYHAFIRPIVLFCELVSTNEFFVPRLRARDGEVVTFREGADSGIDVGKSKLKSYRSRSHRRLLLSIWPVV